MGQQIELVYKDERFGHGGRMVTVSLQFCEPDAA